MKLKTDISEHEKPADRSDTIHAGAGEAIPCAACSLLIVGSGLAGIRAAKDAAEKGIDTIWITDGSLCSGSSFYPLTAGLGSQVADSPEDESVFLREVLETGCTMAEPELTETVIREIAGEVERLPEIGIHPHLQHSDRPACFAKRERLLYSWSGWDEIRREVREIFSGAETVRIREQTELARLLTENGKIRGALVLDEKEQLVFVRCRAVILAAGGFCGLYKHSLNTKETTGVGHSAALDAGAELINMEFMQFIPGFTKPVYKLLFSETTLRRAVSVKDADGQNALEKYLEEHAAESGGVTFRECLEDRAMHGPFTTEDRSRYFELAMMKDALANRRECGFEITFDPGIREDPNGFIRMAREMYARYGIDLSRDRIWLAPFAHCANGGIRIGSSGGTCVPGLFAAGEAAGGIHGADRHGGMATAAALVFGHRCAEAAEKYLKESTVPPADSATLQKEAAEAAEAFYRWTGCGETPEKTGRKGTDSGNVLCTDPEKILTELAERLWYGGNCFRDGKILEELLEWIRQQKDKLCFPKNAGNRKKVLRAFHALRTSEALTLSMLERKESRGPHCRKDYPEKNPELDGKRVRVREVRGSMEPQRKTEADWV